MTDGSASSGPSSAEGAADSHEGAQGRDHADGAHQADAHAAPHPHPYFDNDDNERPKAKEGSPPQGALRKFIRQIGRHIPIVIATVIGLNVAQYTSKVPEVVQSWGSGLVCWWYAVDWPGDGGNDRLKILLHQSATTPADNRSRRKLLSDRFGGAQVEESCRAPKPMELQKLLANRKIDAFIEADGPNGAGLTDFEIFTSADRDGVHHSVNLDHDADQFTRVAGNQMLISFTDGSFGKYHKTIGDLKQPAHVASQETSENLKSLQKIARIPSMAGSCDLVFMTSEAYYFDGQARQAAQHVDQMTMPICARDGGHRYGIGNFRVVTTMAMLADNIDLAVLKANEPEVVRILEEATNWERGGPLFSKLVVRFAAHYSESAAPTTKAKVSKLVDEALGQPESRKLKSELLSQDRRVQKLSEPNAGVTADPQSAKPTPVSTRTESGSTLTVRGRVRSGKHHARRPKIMQQPSVECPVFGRPATGQIEKRCQQPGWYSTNEEFTHQANLGAVRQH
jgi:hypothetical protein